MTDGADRHSSEIDFDCCMRLVSRFLPAYDASARRIVYYVLPIAARVETKFRHMRTLQIAIVKILEISINLL